MIVFYESLLELIVIFFNMFIFTLISLTFSTELKVIAIDKNGASHDHSIISYMSRKSYPQVESISDIEYERGFITKFEILRKDGVKLTAPAPQNANSLMFKVYLIDEEPVMFEASSLNRKQKMLKANIIRPRNINSPIYQTADEQSGGGGLMSKLPLILIGFFILSKVMGRFAPQPQQSSQ